MKVDNTLENHTSPNSLSLFKIKIKFYKVLILDSKDRLYKTVSLIHAKYNLNQKGKIRY